MAPAHSDYDDVTPEQLAEVQRLAFARPSTAEQVERSRLAQETLAGWSAAERASTPQVSRFAEEPAVAGVNSDAQWVTDGSLETEPEGGAVEEVQSGPRQWTRITTVLFLFATLALSALSYVATLVIEAGFGMYRVGALSALEALAVMIPADFYRNGPVVATVVALIAFVMALVAMKRSAGGGRWGQITVLVLSSIAAWNAIRVLINVFPFLNF